MNVLVTDHALTRWRQRVAVYGDAKADEVVAALRASSPLRQGAPLPRGMAWVGGFRYWRHAGNPAVYFVTAPLGIGTERVVTVVDTAAPAPPPKTPTRLRTGKKTDPAPTPADPTPATLPDLPESFADIGEERAWLLAAAMEADGELSRLTRKDRSRAEWVARRSWLCGRLAAVREAWQDWNRRQHDPDGAVIHRENGGINYGPAIRHLLAEVERLSAELAAIRAAG